MLCTKIREKVALNWLGGYVSKEGPQPPEQCEKPQHIYKTRPWTSLSSISIRLCVDLRWNRTEKFNLPYSAQGQGTFTLPSGDDSTSSGALLLSISRETVSFNAHFLICISSGMPDEYPRLEKEKALHGCELENRKHNCVRFFTRNMYFSKLLLRWNNLLA